MCLTARTGELVFLTLPLRESELGRAGRKNDGWGGYWGRLGSSRSSLAQLGSTTDVLLRQAPCNLLVTSRTATAADGLGGVGSAQELRSILFVALLWELYCEIPVLIFINARHQPTVGSRVVQTSPSGNLHLAL